MFLKILGAPMKEVAGICSRLFEKASEIIGLPTYFVNLVSKLALYATPISLFTSPMFPP